MGLFSVAMTDPRCMEVVVEPKQVCLDRAKGFDGDKPRLALASPCGRLHLYKDISITPQPKTVAIHSRKNASSMITQPEIMARERLRQVLAQQIERAARMLR
jgi:hypothetical protein